MISDVLFGAGMDIKRYLTEDDFYSDPELRAYIVAVLVIMARLQGQLDASPFAANQNCYTYPELRAGILAVLVIVDRLRTKLDVSLQNELYEALLKNSGKENISNDKK
jgi:hypothetical protein